MSYVDLNSKSDRQRLDNDDYLVAIENIVESGVMNLDATTVCEILEESIDRNCDLILWNALEIIEARPEVYVTDILIKATVKRHAYTIQLFLIEQLIDRLDHADTEVFLRFLKSDNDQIVRHIAARGVLIFGGASTVDRLSEMFKEEADVLVKIELAAILFLMSGGNSYFSFVQGFARDETFEVARVARECLRLIDEHLS